MDIDSLTKDLADVLGAHNLSNVVSIHLAVSGKIEVHLNQPFFFENFLEDREVTSTFWVSQRRHHYQFTTPSGAEVFCLGPEVEMVPVEPAAV